MDPCQRALAAAILIAAATYFVGALAAAADSASPAPSSAAVSLPATPAATPIPPPDPSKELAARVADAPDDAARDAILAAAPTDLVASVAFRRALNFKVGEIIFQNAFERAVALALYVRHLCIWHGDVLGFWLTEWGMANIDGTRGDNFVALARFQACADYFRSVNDEKRLAGVLTGAGIVHGALGDYRQQVDEYRRAAAVYQRLGQHEGVVSSLNSMGEALDNQGLTERALDQYQQALQAAGDDEAWQAIILHNLATVHGSLGEHGPEREFLQKSSALAQRQDDQRLLAINLDALGRADLETGRLEEADAEFHRALDLATQIGDKHRRSSALIALAEVGWRRGGDGLPAALALAEQASALARDTGDSRDFWRARTLTGKLDRALGQPDRAQTALSEAIAAIEDSRERLPGGDETAAAFFEDKVEPYQQMTALLAEEKRPLDALRSAERAKGRVLLEILRSPQLDPEQLMTTRERENARALAAKVAAANRRLAEAYNAPAPPSPAQFEALQADLRQARLARDGAEADFLAAHPELRDRSPDAGAVLAGDQLQQLLTGANTTFLEYVVADDETLLFVVRAGDEPRGVAPIKVLTIPVRRDDLAARTERFRRALAERSPGWQTAGRDLGELLLPGGRSNWSGTQELVIIPDGPLWDLPFQALSADAALSNGRLQTLWETLPLRLAPSLSFLALSSRTAAAPATSHRPPRLLAVGNPALRPALAGGPRDTAAAGTLAADEAVPLPETERQVRALADLYGAENSRILVGAEADEDLFKSIVGDFDILHLATHGFLNDRAPMYSRLLLSQVDLAPDEDGFLEAWEWLSLRLHARLAVLSACETGRGHIGAGEGVLGMSWALLTAGCPSTVVSQWKVDSTSTTDLMVAFHAGLQQGKRPAAALRDASLALARRPEYRHPFYWAPFVLVGSEAGFETTVR